MQAKTTVENLTVKDAMGDYVGRFANCYNRPTAPDGTKITPTPLDYNWLNNDLALALWYNKVANSIFKSINVIAATLYGHYDGGLNFFVNKATNAFAESFNAEIKAFRATLRGVADIKFFMFRLSKIYTQPPTNLPPSYSGRYAFLSNRMIMACG